MNNFSNLDPNDLLNNFFPQQNQHRPMNPNIPHGQNFNANRNPQYNSQNSPPKKPLIEERQKEKVNENKKHEKISDFSPNTGTYHKLMGNDFFTKGEIEKAITCYSRAIVNLLH